MIMFPLSFDVQPSLAVPNYKMELLLMSATGHVDCIPPSHSMEDAIDAACADPDNYEEGEAHPSAHAVTEMKRVLREASGLFGNIPNGSVAPYSGEISITWRRDNRMLRLTTFSDARPARLDYGTAPEGALGDYQFDTAATGEKLDLRLRWILSAGMPDTR